MINPDDVPDVEDDEMLARFIVAGQSTSSLRKYVRENNTVKPQLFLPYSHVELSVNRHRDCNDGETWSFGQAIAEYRQMAFHGRSDITVLSCTFDKLSVVANRSETTRRASPKIPTTLTLLVFLPRRKISFH